MVKIIDSVNDFYKDTKYLYLGLLGSKDCYCLISTKQYNVKNMCMCNKYGSFPTSNTYWCWNPLEFGRSIVYG